ncbi:hypothetical protein PR202_gb14869 [Eleusine coracana subsp. coracana]|uniref:LIM zinc-binding domain-containing protein n=1 Tax=Eleusine coracana subsp. coracana TaxID=191504 RepID=A0AAV5EWW7_ELECO|nr:hypothetical protein PR202_gb14869 [Eleusine coracana subsp. coracana]
MANAQCFVIYPLARAEERNDRDLGERVQAGVVGTMSFTGTQDKCNACDKTVHFIDLLTADGVIYHKTCFKCSHCKGILSMCSYSSMDGVLYCKTHFEQLFKETGSFSKKFTPVNLGRRAIPQELLQMLSRRLHTDNVLLRRAQSCFCKIHFSQLFMEKGSYNHMKKKSESQEALPDVVAEEEPAAPPQDEEAQHDKVEDN